MDQEPPLLIEPEVLEEPGSEVVAELEHEPEQDNATKPEPQPAVVDEPKPEPEIGEPLVETSANLSKKLAMELVLPTGDMFTGDHAIHGAKYS